MPRGCARVNGNTGGIKDIWISGYDPKVRPTRFLAIIIYMAYLVNVGLLLVLIPWSLAWGRVLTHLPTSTAVLFDSPWVRGVISAFGVLHLLLVVWELVNPTLLTVRSNPQLRSQNDNRS